MSIKKRKNFKKPTISQEYNKKLLSFSDEKIAETYKDLNSSENGLSIKQVEVNSEKYGMNNVISNKKHH
ncbi:MAG: hypothetical protein K2L48_00555 [Mycoplasmoidaceae bacterium]|nr:hypothetical protein [Mycoplasmoidaceae bacterium]